MSMLIRKKKKKILPWFIRAIVAFSGNFRVHLGLRRCLKSGLSAPCTHLCKDVWLIRFMHGVVRNGLLKREVYKLHARTDGFFCQVEKLEYNNLTVKTV